MKFVPNVISILRIFLSILLVLVEPLSLTFFLIYLACGWSDILDGYIARKKNVTSQLGAKLDSVADLIMIIVLVMILLPIIHLTIPMIVWIIFIVVIRVISLVLVYVKYNAFAILHTYGNKLTGFMLFAFPLLLAFGQFNALIYCICALATLSAIEELCIHLSSSELRINQKSIFLK